MLLPVDSMDREDMLGGIDRDAFEFHSGGLSWQFHRPNVGTFDAVGPSTPTDGIRNPVPNTRAALKSLCTKRVLWIVGSTERHLIQLFHPGINAQCRR